MLMSLYSRRALAFAHLDVTRLRIQAATVAIALCVACGTDTSASDDDGAAPDEMSFDSQVPDEDDGVTDDVLDQEFVDEVELLSAVQDAQSPSCPAAARSGGRALWANLEACGWPGPANTGPTSGSLARRGSVVLARDGETLKNARVDGCIVVTARNVTISNVLVSFAPDGGACSSNAGMSAINIAAGASATISDTEVDGNGKVHIGIRNAGEWQRIQRVDIHDTEDGVFAQLPAESRAAFPRAGSHTVIRDSYFHDFVPRSFNNKEMLDSRRPNGHIDAVQTDGGAVNTYVVHNTMRMNFGAYVARYSNGSTKAPPGQANGYIDSATAFWNGVNRDLRNVLVANNLFAAEGGFIHYAYDRTGKVNGVCADNQSSARGDECGSVTNIRFLNNRYSTIYNTCVGGFGVWFSRGTPTGGWAAPGNGRDGNIVLETGVSVNETGLPRRPDGTACQ